MIIKEIEWNIFGYYTGLNEKIEIGIPIPVMLSKSLSKYEEIEDFLKKFDQKNISVECKYDGERT